MRALVILLFAVFLQSGRAEEDLRSGTAKDCYLYSWGKGPNWSVKVSTEFHLSLLNRQMPNVDDRFSEPTEKALTWVERQREPEVTAIATVEGRKVVQVVYPEQGSFGKSIGTILLAIETARDSEWFSPFFVARPELYRGQFVSGRDVAFGYVATLALSGTGSFRKHLLYDLRRDHPVILSELDSGRVVHNEFETDREYEEALTIFDHEADLLAGSIPDKKTERKAKGMQDGVGQPAFRPEPNSPGGDKPQPELEGRSR